MAILYGDEGEELIWLSWIWFVLATVLFAIRSFNASRGREGVPSFVGVRWDYILIAVAFVSVETRSVIFMDGNRLIKSRHWRWSPKPLSQ